MSRVTITRVHHNVITVAVARTPDVGTGAPHTLPSGQSQLEAGLQSPHTKVPERREANSGRRSRED